MSAPREHHRLHDAAKPDRLQAAPPQTILALTVRQAGTHGSSRQGRLAGRTLNLSARLASARASTRVPQCSTIRDVPEQHCGGTFRLTHPRALATMSRLAENPTEASDEMLMVRYQRGNRDAFATLVSRHSACVFSVAFYLRGDENAAEHIAGATFHHLASDAATFHMEVQFRTWLFGKVHGIIGEDCVEAQPNGDLEVDWRDHLTRLDSQQAESVSPPSSRAYRSQILLRRVTSRVTSLPLEMREAFLFKQVGQLSIVAIADAMSLDTDTVRQLIRSAFDRIQEGVMDTEEYARALR